MLWCIALSLSGQAYGIDVTPLNSSGSSCCVQVCVCARAEREGNADKCVVFL